MTNTQKLFNEALAALNSRDLARAEALFRRVVQADNKHVPALNLLAVVLMSRGRFAEAETFIERATKLNGTSDASFYNYGLISKHLGKPQQAIDQFSKAIALNPNAPDSWNNRGTVFNDLEKFELALSDFEKALSLNGGYAEGHANRGKCLTRLGRYEDALAAYDKALALKADLAEAWVGKGNVLRDFSRRDEALAAYNKALEFKPDLAEAWLGRGNVFVDLRRHDEALAAYAQALSANPDLDKAWLGRGNVFSSLNRQGEALAEYDKALALKPDLAEAGLGRGNVFSDGNRHSEALAAHDRALALKPDLAEAWLGRGNASSVLKRQDEALAAYDRALALKPDLAKAWLGRGNVFRILGQPDEASNAYQKALSLMPDLAEASLRRGNVLNDLRHHDEAVVAFDTALSLKPDLAEAWLGRGHAFNNLARLDDAFSAYDRALSLKPDLMGVEGYRLMSKMQLCDWRNFETDCEHLIESIRNNKVNADPFAFLGINSSVEDQHQCARLWIDRLYPPGQRPPVRGGVHKRGRIHVGYLSGDFHEHATAHLMAGVFERHDKSRFNITALSIGPDDQSPMRQRLKDSFENFVDATMLDDAEVAKRIRAAGIDLLIDLKGFTRGARTNILALRPAPMQINYLGYPGTMGASFIDYLIADPLVVPRTHWIHYSEKIVYLPHNYQANDATRNISDKVFTKTECGLPETGFIFCCFNNNFKVTPILFDRWMRILTAVKGSVLWLLEDNATAADNLRKEAGVRGVDPARLVFATRMPPSDHLARHRLADLFLDTLPYNAHTTASDALWTGLPVLTQIGQTFAGRVAASLLAAMNLPELITKTPEEYEQLATDLAFNPERLRTIKSRLAENRSAAPLFDTELFTRHIEAAYVAIYERHRAGLAPDHLSIPN